MHYEPNETNVANTYNGVPPTFSPSKAMFGSQPSKRQRFDDVNYASHMTSHLINFNGRFQNGTTNEYPNPHPQYNPQDLTKTTNPWVV